MSVGSGVTVVIPTSGDDRAEMLIPLLDQLPGQTLRPDEVLVVRGDRRQGRAINRAARVAGGDVLVTLDDDTRLGHPEVLERVVGLLRDDPTVGLSGAATEIPPDAPAWLRAAYRQIPRRWFPAVETAVDSDMVQHPCLAIRRELFFAIGGEDEEIPRGLDPLLREKVRARGLRVAIAPRAFVYHLLPGTFAGIWRQSFRNGRGSATVRRHWPDRVRSLSDGHEEGRPWEDRPSFFLRSLNVLAGMAVDLVTLRWIRLAYRTAYVSGYLSVTLSPGSPASPPRTGEILRLTAAPDGGWITATVTEPDNSGSKVSRPT